MKRKRRNTLLIIVIGIITGISVSQTTDTAPYFVSFIERFAEPFIDRSEENKASLHKAAQRGNARKIRQMLDNGTEVNAKDEEGRTPLYLAAACGQDEALKILLENGANVDGQSYEPGVTALFGAVQNNRIKTAKILIKNGADVNFKAPTFPQNPLQQATAFGYIKMAQILIDSGANVNERDSYSGMTALYMATVSGNKKMVSLLAKNGADETIPDNYGQTPEQATAIMQSRKTHKLVKARDGSDLFDTNSIVQIVYLGTTQEGITYRGPNRVGFVIGNDSLIVTAAHCLEDFLEDSRKGTLVRPQVISRYYGDIFEADILAIDKKADVAILQVAWDEHPAIELAATEEFKDAKEIIIAAYPPPRTEISEGNHYREVFMERLPVIKLDDNGESEAIVLGGGEFDGPGWSGSPLLLTGSGKVAGVFGRNNLKQFQSKTFLHTLMGCNVNSIHSLLQSNRNKIYKHGKNDTSESRTNAENTFHLFISCFEAYAHEDYALAFKKMKEVVCLRQQSVNAHLMLALLAKIINIKDKDAQAITLAESSYKEALRLAPENFIANAGYGNFLLENKQNSKAVVFLKKAVELEPDSSFVLLKLVDTLRDQDSNEMEIYVRRLVDKFPENAGYWFELSRILEKTGQHDEELETARKCVSLSKDVPYQYRRRLADALTNKKHLGEADENFKLLLEDHECAACWFAYSKLLTKLGPHRYDDAIRALEKAESMNRDKVVSSEKNNELYKKLFESDAPVKSEITN